MFCPKCRAEYKEGFSRCADCDIDLVPKLSPEPEPSVKYIDFIKIITYSSRHEAELAKGFLSVNGINAVVFGDDYGGLQPGLSFSTGVQLLVKEKDVQKAEEILSQIEQGKFDMPENIDIDEKDEQCESKDINRASFKGIFTGILIGILVGLSINYIYNAVEKYRQKNLSWVYKVDSKKDGKPNLFYYYQKGVLVEMEADRNFDGKIDERCFYKGGVINYCELDNNFDGFFETKSYFKNAILSRVEIYSSNDKNPNVVQNYVDGVIYDSEYYHELTHKIWKKELYENGIISEEYIDQDSKGEFDILIRYNKYGRLVKITHLTKE